jgi:exodeoxyribonuclease-5
MPVVGAVSRSVSLSREQRAAVDLLLSRQSRQIQTLGGYAGTGKTTVIKTLKNALQGWAVAAFTGKAANVLRRKGISSASTIHSLIYKPHTVQKIDGKGRIHEFVEFQPKAPSELLCKGFIIDEASMVSREIHEALMAYNRPIIYVGDHGQLEPVSAERGFNLMAKPDITLQTIHRNAGEIAHFANFIREGNAARDWEGNPLCSGEAVQFVSLDDLDKFGEPDQIIVAFNHSRVHLNEQYRDVLGFPAHRPVKGDRIMCLQNDRVRGLYNGQQGTIGAIASDEIEFVTDDDVINVRYLPEVFNSPKPSRERDRQGRIPFDYCYAITCHKAQGDEWPSVLVFEQHCRFWDHNRWAYTAASRARERLYWLPLGD